MQTVFFETRLYNMFLLQNDEQESDMYREGARMKNQFIQNGHLNMRKVLEKFVEYFDDIYGDRDEKFMGKQMVERDILCCS